MKLLQSLVTFAYLAQSHVIEIPAQTLSDGANCIWVAGSYGQRVHCPDSSIAVGSCTSNYRSECDNGKYFHMLNCCDIGKREKPQDCHTVHNNDGLMLNCPSHHSVYGACYSGQDDHACRFTDNDGHDHKVYDEIQCCMKKDIHVSDTDCHWHSGRYGDRVMCREGEAIHSVCGNGHGNRDHPVPKQCEGDANHIACCHYNLDPAGTTEAPLPPTTSRGN